MISTKSTYGIRALLYITLKGYDQKIAIKEIAEKENISGRYLEQIFSSLKQGGIVNSVKGAGGGYILAKDPKNISMKDIMELLEKDLYCQIEDIQDSNKIDYTLNEHLWKEYNNQIKKHLKSISLADLATKHKENQNLMYYI